MQEVPVFYLRAEVHHDNSCVHDITVLYLHQLPEGNPGSLLLQEVWEAWTNSTHASIVKKLSQTVLRLLVRIQPHDSAEFIRSIYNKNISHIIQSSSGNECLEWTTIILPRLSTWITSEIIGLGFVGTNLLFLSYFIWVTFNIIKQRSIRPYISII